MSYIKKEEPTIRFNLLGCEIALQMYSFLAVPRCTLRQTGDLPQ